MKDMGKRRLVDKAIRPLTTTLTNVTPAMVTASGYANIGRIPMAYYKGNVAFWDLDLAVNQPNVVAEQKWMLGILSGRELAYDFVTVNAPITTVAGTLLSGTLTVPTGELWLVNAVRMACPGDAVAGFTMNWYCSLWTDRVGALGFGQPFHDPAAALGNLVGLATHVNPAGGAIVQLDEFGEIATAWLASNKVPLLRLPAGTVITFTVLTDSGLPAVATACTLQLYGSMAKILVA